MEIDLKQLRDLMKAIRQFDLSEIEIEKNGERIALRRSSANGSPIDAVLPLASVPPQGSVAPAPPPVAVMQESVTEDSSVAYVTSPFVGTFYRAPSPDGAPFVDVGQRIKPKQVLCIVEAMKLMNEIEAEFAGILLEVLVANGKPVEFGERLFKVKKS